MRSLGRSPKVPSGTPEFCRHLSSKESLLLLSQWIRIPRDDLHIRHATNSWLSPDKVNVALGPIVIYHPIQLERYLWISAHLTLICSSDPRKLPGANLNFLLEEVLVTLRLQVDSCGPSALIQILLGGTPIRCRNHHLWIHAVRDYFDDVPLCVPNCQLRLPVLDRLNTTMETCVLPPISLSLSTLIPVSAFPGLFQHLSSASRSIASLKPWGGHTRTPR